MTGDDRDKTRGELQSELDAVRVERDRAAGMLSAILQSSFDTIVSIGLDGSITSFNPAAERALGYTAAEVVGQPLSDFYPPEQLACIQETVDAVRQGRVVEPYRTQRRSKTGAMVDMLITVAPVKNGTNEVVGGLAIGQDLTEVLRLEHQFVLAQKMEAIGRLAGGVAHDFNNLLTVINGYSDLLLDAIAPQDPRREALVEIANAGERAALLTGQLLAFSRQQVLEPRVLNLNAVISHTEKMLRRLIGEDIILAQKLDATLLPVKADPGQVQQILMNLVVNARDAMPEGGRVTIETSNVTVDESDSRVSAGLLQPGEYAMLAVSDTGIGMDEDTRARIFEPFFTTKEQGKGTGLGLPMVYGIVKQSGGSIEVSSEPRRGATFSILLPRAMEREPLPRSADDVRTIPRGSEIVLLVEDEDAVRAFARQVLQSCGYTVQEASNGRDALDLVDTHDIPVHLLISDVVMPHLGGRELAERLKSRRPGLKVLFLSGYIDHAVVRDGVLEAEGAFLQKPFTTSSLAQKVRAVLDSTS